MLQHPIDGDNRPKKGLVELARRARAAPGRAREGGGGAWLDDAASQL